MAQQYPLDVPNVRVTIAGTNRTSEVLAGSLQVTAILGSQVDVCQLQMKAAESYRASPGVKPTVGQEILIEVDTTGTQSFQKLFGGFLSRVAEVRIAYKTRRWDIDCVDYTSLLNRILVNKYYVNETISNIASDVVKNYAPFVSTSGIDANTIRIHPSVTFARLYPSDILRALGQDTGFEWFVTPDKVCRFFDPDQAPRSPLQVTDASDNFFDLYIEPQIDQVRNRVVVQGGNALSEQFTEEWIANGVLNTFDLNNTNIIAPNLSPLPSGTLSPFMTINGVQQVVGIRGVSDESAVGAKKGFLLDPQKGIVQNTAYTPTIPDGAKIVFTYKTPIPIIALREDRASQSTIAALDGSLYATVVGEDTPLHWWKLDETSGNTAVNYGSAGTAYSGMYIGQFEPGNCGPLTGNQGGAPRFFGGRIQTYSGTQIPRSAYTLEAWAQVDKRTTGGILGQWTLDLNSGGVEGTGAGIIVSGGLYHIRHQNLAFSSNVPNKSAGFDHVVATWNGSAFRMYINKETQIIAPTAGALDVPAVSGIEIGNLQYVAHPQTVNGLIAHAAVYDYALSPQRVAAHYDAGRYGGVREAVVIDNNINSLAQARRRGDAELARWAQVITDIRFRSFVPGWVVGDRIVVSVSGVGSTYSGFALIQDIAFRWMGAQRVEYNVHCVSTRFNLVDYYREISRQRDVIQGKAVSLDLSEYIPTNVILMGGGTVTAFEATPPFYIAPDWGLDFTPYAKVEMSTTNYNSY